MLYAALLNSGTFIQSKKINSEQFEGYKTTFSWGHAVRDGQSIMSWQCWFRLDEKRMSGSWKRIGYWRCWLQCLLQRKIWIPVAKSLCFGPTFCRMHKWLCLRPLPSSHCQAQVGFCRALQCLNWAAMRWAAGLSRRPSVGNNTPSSSVTAPKRVMVLSWHQGL